MEQILLINPSKRKPKMRKTRSAAQRAATKRMLAANRARRTNPAKRRPAKRRVIRHAAPAKRRRNPITLFAKPRKSSRRRRNPIITGTMTGLLKEGLYGAAGALAIDVAMNWLPLPAVMRQGTMGIVTRAGAALLLGTMGRKVFGPAAAQMGAGALTVQTYGLLKQYLPASMTGLGYVSAGQIAHAQPAAIGSPAATSSGMSGMGMYVPVGGGMGLGEYVQ